jgi:hypothetical protein
MNGTDLHIQPYEIRLCAPDAPLSRSQRLPSRTGGKAHPSEVFGKVRDDINLDECSVRQLKVKANDGEPTES